MLREAAPGTGLSARRGRKPKPVPSPGLQAGGLPRCPDHLDVVARNEWRRLARPLFDAGILTIADRAAFAAYCQAYARWVEAERKLQQTPKLLKAPSGYVQQSPWLSVVNKQLEIMGRYMAELGLTPAARSRVAGAIAPPPGEMPTVIRIVAGGRDDEDSPRARIIQRLDRLASAQDAEEV